MCLIICKTKDSKLDENFLRGVFRKNSDGLGVMYAEGNVLYSVKVLPKTFEDVKDFWNKYVSERECFVHFRMQTHGHIDMENCHPYEVLSEADGYPLYMIHNGVLHTDNRADVTKSDTWHYINDYLRPMLLKNPEFFMHPAFSELVSEHIGSGNKFVFLDAYGNSVIINKKAFVEHEGALLSNTYAWDTSGTAHSWSTGRSSFRRRAFDYDDAYCFGYEGWGGALAHQNDTQGGESASEKTKAAAASGATAGEAAAGTLDGPVLTNEQEREVSASDREDFVLAFFTGLRNCGLPLAYTTLTPHIMDTYYDAAIDMQLEPWDILDDVYDKLAASQSIIAKIKAVIEGADAMSKDIHEGAEVTSTPVVLEGSAA